MDFDQIQVQLPFYPYELDDLYDTQNMLVYFVHSKMNCGLLDYFLDN